MGRIITTVCVHKLKELPEDRSKQPDNLARLGVKPDLPKPGASAEPWHGLHVAQERVQEPSSCRQSDCADRYGETYRTSRIASAGGSARLRRFPAKAVALTCWDPLKRGVM